MATYYVNNSDGRTFWQPNTVYSVGQRCCAAATETNDHRTFKVYECTTGGTSGGSQPVWNTNIGGTTNDNSVVWTTRWATSWADAHPSLTLMIASYAQASGDMIKVHKAHNEVCPSTDGNEIYGFRGTPASPNVVVCVDKDSSDALSSGAVVQMQKSSKNITNHTYVIWVNMQLIFDGYLTTNSTQHNWTWKMISVGTPLTVLTLNGPSSYILVDGFYYTKRLVIINSNIKCAYAANYINNQAMAIVWRGGKIIAPNGVTALFRVGTYGGVVIDCEDVDLSEIGVSNEIFRINSRTGTPPDIKLTRCKMATSPPGFFDDAGFPTSQQGYQGTVRLHQCSSLNRVWEFYELNYEGQVQSEVSITRQNGASVGGQPISWKMVSTTYVHGATYQLRPPAISFWHPVAASSTVTIHGILDSATNLQDDELFMDISYPADNTSGLGAIKTTRKYATWETVTDLPTSTATWLGTGGMSNPNKFKITATFTPGKAGPVKVQIGLGKPSTTLYICPKVEIS